MRNTGMGDADRRIRRLAMLGVAAGLATGCGGGSDQVSVAEAPKTDEAAAETTLDAPLHFSKTGWHTDFGRHSVPLSEIRSGGPGKDGIPALDGPALVPVAEANAWLEDREPVIELELRGEARAYPLQILIWHEIVNDVVGGTPIAATFCPLCNTTIVFDRRLDGKLLDFGTTGNLRNADLVMYDRQTESWWQQFSGEAIVGELTGSRLERVPARIVGWKDFATRHPNGTVLSRETGFERPYGQNPYTGYDDVDSPPLFPASNSGDDRLPPKERVVYLESGGEAVAVPFTLLERRKSLELELGDRRLELEFQPGVRSSLDSLQIGEGRDVGSVSVRSVPSGEAVPFDTPFWFAVAAFRPDVHVVTE